MEIKIAKSAGFCFGVKNAVELAEKTAKEKGKVYSLGEIIHNKIVIDKLKCAGVFPEENLENIPDNSTVIIRSHGVGKAVIDELLGKNCEIIDATCPFVSKIHQIVKEKYELGYGIIIVGEPTHPEVLGTNGWCENSAIILSKPLDFSLNTEKKYCAVVQTTFSVELCQKIMESVKNAVKTVEFFNTICYTTKERQAEAVELASQCEAMFVLGAKHSSNTSKLFELCKQVCPNTFLIENISDLHSVVANKFYRSGITAGASTPEELIEEVVKTMSESQQKSDVTLNEETACNQANDEVTTKTTDSMSMEELLKDSFRAVEIRQGNKYKVTVISANEKGISVSFGGKKDGFIDKTEVELLDSDFNPENYKEGDVFDAIVIEGKDKNAIAFSKKRIDIKIKEQKECEEILKGGEFSVVIDKAVKGGLTGRLGPYTIFVPASQIRIGYVSDLEKYVGKKLRLAILPPKAVDGEMPQEVSLNSKRIVASQRIILEKEKNEREDSFWSTMQINSIVKGKVKRFSDFGAFVMVNGFDCLAHISDLSWYKINDPGEVLELNNTYDFVVIKADRENGKVSLGYKQLQMKPYEIAAEKFPIGSVIKGKVERVFPYGAFVSIDKGVDGLVPVSEISHSWIKNASEAYKPGDEVEALIINFEGNKITLSVKALLPEPEISEMEENMANEEKSDDDRQSKKRPATKRAPRAKKQDDGEIKEWSTDDGNTTLGDLFKGLDFDFDKE